MYRTLDTSMLNIPYTYKELAPICAKYGIQAIGVSGDVLESMDKAIEADKYIKSYGLRWGLLPMTADFYQWELSDEKFDEAIEMLKKRAEIAEKIGIQHAYNHVWPTSFREFDENFEWHVKRVKTVADTLADYGVEYGLEFLGPHELRKWQKYEFVHSLAGVLAIADEADGKAGIAFDTFHWYTSTNGVPDDMIYMSKHIDRLVAIHLNDAVAGIDYSEQKDMQRRLPMETGVINSKDIFARFKMRENNALYMIEPFEPSRTLFHSLTPEEAVKKAAETFAKVEG